MSKAWAGTLLSVSPSWEVPHKRASATVARTALKLSATSCDAAVNPAQLMTALAKVDLKYVVLRCGQHGFAITSGKVLPIPVENPTVVKR